MTAWLQGAARDIVRRAAAGEVDAARAEADALTALGRAGVLVVCDLVEAGWTADIAGDRLDLQPPARASGREAERARVRAQLVGERARQLASPAVRAFIRRMESPRRFGASFRSIFDLMRDGRDLARALEERGPDAIQPALEVVAPGDRCDRTGLELTDIWRYFRHTWLTPYRSSPGRGVMYLVRDEGATSRPVIGITMLGSAPSQIAARDRWIGWEPDQVVEECRERPSAERAAWLRRTLDEEIRGIWTDDLMADGLILPGDLRSPGAAVIARLEAEGRARRLEHRAYGDRQLLREIPAVDAAAGWRARARSPLFRGKRAELLARLLSARAVVGSPTAEDLPGLAASEAGRRAIRLVARRWKAGRMGVALADIQVCGAISPYRELLGGKLVAMLMTSAEALEAYEARYAGAPSVIASSMAGRPVVRDARLALLTTTGLFGRSSQYSRLRGGAGMGAPYIEVGMTEGYGSLHLSEGAGAALATCVTAASRARRDSLFGEGVNPRMRTIRDGLALLGLSDEVIRHGARRSVYVVPLARDAQRSLAGLDVGSTGGLAACAEATRIAAWWRARWAEMRWGPDTSAEVRRHTTERPIRHGARALPHSASETSTDGQSLVQACHHSGVPS